MKRPVKYTLWGLIVVAAIAGLALAFRAPPVIVDLARVTRGKLAVSVDDDGRTRVRERYRVSAPIDGQLLRVSLEPGDPVEARTTVLAEFQPLAARYLDARSLSEARARRDVAERALDEASARRVRAAAELDFAEQQLARQRNLAASGTGTAAALDQAVRDEKQARAAELEATRAEERAKFELELAEVSLVDPSFADGGDDGRSDESETARTERRIELTAPIDGTVLRVHEESARPLTAGTPILDVGQVGDLEVVADFLSQAAVKVRPGMRVIVEGWGGVDGTTPITLRGSVQRVEPSGYTKVSALGVEEQRVDIVIDPSPGDSGWSALGDGFQVEVRIVVWEEEDVLIVPTGALFREGEHWAVFVDAEGTAEKREVEIGRRNGLEAQVLRGLSERDAVVLYPSELVSDGARIESR